jgi:hypothetical protein
MICAQNWLCASVTGLFFCNFYKFYSLNKYFNSINQLFCFFCWIMTAENDGFFWRYCMVK